MKFTTLISSFLCLGILGCTQPPSDEPGSIDPAVVDNAISEVVSEGKFPFLYARVEKFDGSVVYEHSAINSEFADQSPTGESWMRIWSMSKSVTIATILDLEEDGILDRTDPVTEYIPEFSKLMVLGKDTESDSCEKDLKKPSRDITIEDLLNHNDGFYYPFTGHACIDNAMKQARLPEAKSSDALINRIAKLPLHPDGVGQNQYGIGTTILGLVAERATGLGFDEIVESRLTAPLGISETLKYTLPKGTTMYPRVSGADGSLRIAKKDELDIFGGPVPEYGSDTSIYLGGEGMVGTTKAFAKFLRLMGNMGELDGVRILDESTVKDWYAPKTQLDSPYGKNGFNIWVTSGKFDGLPNQKPGLLVGGGYEGTAFWIDIDAGYVGLIMSQVHSAPTDGVDEVSRIRGLIYENILEPGVVH
ncbi:MAG: serine hydrolase [Litorimonas sp.]